MKIVNSEHYKKFIIIADKQSLQQSYTWREATYNFRASLANQVYA